LLLLHFFLPLPQVLCKTGSCFATSSSVTGQGLQTYSGSCSSSPVAFVDVYGKQCDPSKRFQCQYIDPLAPSPYQYSSMQCAASPGSPFDYSCLLGPNKAGDACFYNSECASGICSSKGSGEGGAGSTTCVGISAGGPCIVPLGTSPDPCAAGLFCDPGQGTQGFGKCSAVAPRDATCTALAGCERGYVCAGDGSGSPKKCTAYMSVPIGGMTTVGNYMCAGGTGLQVRASPPLFKCVDPALVAGQTGVECDPSRPLPTGSDGYECACASSGRTLLRPIGGYGLGFNSKAYSDLTACFASAETPNLMPCSYDFTDFERMRYGSCVFYACYPYYQRLMNGTGGRWYAPPLSQFS
jgi:hypothetical protein